MEDVPEWLPEAAQCPEDAGLLQREPGAVRCETCGRAFPVEGGVVALLPDRLAHLHRPPPAPEAGATASDVRWIEDELHWWNPWWEQTSLKPHSPRAGLRGRSRERHLFRHVRDQVGPRPLVVEMGAGNSRTIAGLWPPASNGLRYVATDVSAPALLGGRRILGPKAASVQCDAVSWPMREGVADIVLVLGVLHHLSDWRAALERACATVRPGGFLLMHEAVTKPQVLRRVRHGGMDDGWVSPHEGDVPAGVLRAELEQRGTVKDWRGEESPLRFGLVRYLITNRGLDDRLESSPRVTALLDVLDQLFGRGPGRLVPSLGFNEVTAIWQRPTA